MTEIILNLIEKEDEIWERIFELADFNEEIKMLDVIIERVEEILKREG